MYICKLCSFSTVSAISYVKHCRVHSCNSAIPCGVPHCAQSFRKMASFYSHVSRCHGVLRRRVKYSFLYTTGLLVKCNVTGCDKVLNFAEMIRHMKAHIDAGIAVNCPAQSCGRLMRKKSTFTAHLSVKHGMLNKMTVDSSLLIEGTSNNDDSLVDSHSLVLPSEATVETDNAEDDVGDGDVVGRDNFMRNFALFFLKLQCQQNVPASTVDLIGKEIYNLHRQNADTWLQAMKSQLTSTSGSCTVIEEMVDVLQRGDLFAAALNSADGLLRSQHKRRYFYKNNFRYVEPVEKKLGQNMYGKPSLYHYIPVQDTLQSLMRDESVFQCVTSFEYGSTGRYADVHDGHVYNHIQQTVKHLPFIQIMLYQDAFEVVNPIGSARKMHKIVAVYMALANLPVHLRMSADNLQLVLLCRETDINYFGQDTVFQDLVRDLQDLESSGVNVNGQVYEVRLISFLGDNLGSHWLGGFSTNFSTNKYVCRYCLVQKTEESCSLCKTASVRTPELYNDAVKSLTDTVLSVQGIVRSSVLNSLKYYHVCLPGLPPCLGHDLFEGIVQYDLSLILKVLSKSNTGNTAMYFQHLNRTVKHFQFLGADANDKPGVVSNGKTVGGNAVQVWCLLRLLPLLLCDTVNVQTEAWKLLLLLRETVELICAPKLSVAQVWYLNRLIRQYVEDRHQLFPSVPLRPKHHYLLHYPWLIQMFGPLIGVWTMRMESKHSFFKRCARSCRNFINITKSLSETHQLNQAYLSSGARVCRNVELGCDSCDFDSDLLSSGIVSAVKTCRKLQSPLCCSSSVTVKGTKYSKGSFVVLNCIDSQPVFGKILLCLLDSVGTPAVVTEVYHSEKNQALGLFVVRSLEEVQTLKCVLTGDLFDYYPLPLYSILGVPHIALKHAVYVSA